MVPGRGLNPLKSGQAFGLFSYPSWTSTALVSIPSNRGKPSDQALIYVTGGPVKSQSPQIGASLRTYAIINTRRRGSYVSIPSNRGKPSDTIGNIFFRLNALSQSPQIGASLRTDADAFHQSPLQASLNPLKSGQAFGHMPSGILPEGTILSQSPQIGASLRT